ncbi:hypothetical protein HMPREF0880_02210 [Yokenella regensburgei ATCC 43003]|nr:hypothetical protein HMPREF0880_02210 [Yokenella regensburgei ATCC 43003]
MQVSFYIIEVDMLFSSRVSEISFDVKWLAVEAMYTIKLWGRVPILSIIHVNVFFAENM